MYNWSLFLISVGGVFIMLSSTIEQGMGLLALGIFLIGLGIYLIYKRKKGN